MRKYLLGGLLSCIMLNTSYGGNISQEILKQDAHYATNYKRAATLLENRGYEVIKIDINHFDTTKTTINNDNAILDIHAQKHGHAYKIVMSYPNLKIVSETRYK